MVEVINMLKFAYFQDGDMLTSRDGTVVGDRKLVAEITVKAEKCADIYINDTKAVWNGTNFAASILFDKYETTVVAENRATGESEEIVLYWLPDFAGKYRVSLDDNIWFLREIYENDYDSIFDSEYMAFWKELHDEFGTKVHINIYYVDEADFCITQFPDKYKAEWASCKDWLRLSFHAKQDQPGRPYLNAGYDEMYKDVTDVRREIQRFAGSEVMGPVTTLHFGDATREGARALRDAGYPVLLADFNGPFANLPVAYYLTSHAERQHMIDRFVWRDRSEDITFVRCAIIANCYEEEEIPVFLDAVARDPHRGAFIDILIHEQYFFPHFAYFQANYKDKMRTAVKWAIENGYESAFLEDIATEW